MEEEWNPEGLEQALANDFDLALPIKQWLEQDNTLDSEAILARVQAGFTEAYKHKEEEMGASMMRQFEKAVMLQTLDTCWREHLSAMDYLRQGIHLRGYAQKNPKQEYKRESFELFSQLLDRVNYDTISAISKFEVRVEEDLQQMEAQQRQSLNQQSIQYNHVAPVDALNLTDEVEVQEGVAVDTFVRNAPKVGRNDPCPCGSGKKYKKCCGG